MGAVIYYGVEFLITNKNKRLMMLCATCLQHKWCWPL